MEHRMAICVTRYNNKTLYENMVFNLHLPVCEDVKKHRDIFKEWKAVKIPRLEKLIEKYRKQLLREECTSKRRLLRKQINFLRNDMDILINAETDYYKSKLYLLNNSLVQSENMDWIYNVPITIHPSVNKKNLYVFEMNNDMNQIIGVSKLINICYHRRNNIYTERNYNRYSYKAKRVSIIHPSLNPFRVQLEAVLFTGSTHQKRGHGIQKIAQRNLERLNHEDLIVILDEIFKQRL
jgi:hypothetical protein